MGLFAFVRDIITAKARKMNLSSYSDEVDSQAIGAISQFAVFTAIDYIASLVSKVEFKTYEKDKEIKGAEWYSLNLKPNKNQSSTEFWQEAVGNLLYSGELLIIPVGRQKIIATNFDKDEKAITETIFKNVRRNDFTFYGTFRASEVIYIRYAQFDTAAILAQIISFLSALVNEAADKYIKSGGQKGALEIPMAANNILPEDKEANAMFAAAFKSYYAAKNAVMPLRNGIKYTPQNSSGTAKASNEVSDIRNLIDEALTRAAQSYKIPPQLLTGSVTGTDEALDLLLTVCIDPLINCISEELSGKEFAESDFLKGSYIEADSTNIKHFDIFSQAANVEKLIGSAFTNVDELRGKASLKEIGAPWAKKHFMTKNFSPVENMNSAEGGG